MPVQWGLFLTSLVHAGMADTEMKEAVAQPTEGKAVLDRNVSSDEESDEEEGMIGAMLEVRIKSHATLAFRRASSGASPLFHTCL